MCCGPNLNLCRCGCPQSSHEEVVDVLEMALRVGDGEPLVLSPLPLPTKYGRCLGVTIKPLSIEELEAARLRGEQLELTQPCNCAEFRPFLEPLCRMP